MKNKKSTSREDIKNLIDESHDFLSALNSGASSNELNEIKSRLKANDKKDIRQMDREASGDSDEAA